VRYDGEPVYRAVAERQPDPPAAVVVPPRASAVPSPTADTAPTQRDRHIRMIRDRGAWAGRRAVGYGSARSGKPPCSATRPSSVVVFAPGLCLPEDRSQGRCSVLNRMTRLGMPVSQHIA
jgi:hypothetical protein